jgi:hypothetical protein
VDEQHFANRRRQTADATVGKVMLVDERRQISPFRQASA